jgi:hypothetical protein
MIIGYRNKRYEIKCKCGRINLKIKKEIDRCICKDWKELLLRRILNEYRDGDLTIKDIEELCLSRCYYCGLEYCNELRVEEFVLRYNGLDRIDNSRGHYRDNVVPCCKYCNYLKLDGTQEEFFERVNRIYKKHC